jgi:hypothetical protein
LTNAATVGDTITTISFYVSSVLNAIPATAASISSTYLASNLTITTPTIDTITSAASTALTLKSAGTNGVIIDTSQNLQFNSGFGSVATAYGCRAWVNFNGTGTIAIRASGNVSSITDDGTGKYRVNFTTAMPDIDYAANVSVSSMPAVSDANLCVFNDNSGARGDPTTGAIRVSTFNAQFNYLDITYIYVSIFR